jgi:hypothetical protein
MSDKEKATFLANLLAKQEIKLTGAREAFRFTQAYQWLLDQAKKQDKNNGN